MRFLRLDVRMVTEMVFTIKGESLIVAGLTSLPNSTIAVYRFDLKDSPGAVELGLNIQTDDAMAIHPTGQLAIFLETQDYDELGRVGVYQLDGRDTPQMCASSITVKSVYGLAFGRAGDRLAVTCDFSRDYQSDDGVFVWDTASSQAPIRFRTPFRPANVILSPDDRTLVVASDFGGYYLWTYDLPTGYFQTIDAMETRSIAVSTTGKYIATGGRRIAIWDLEGMYRESFFRGQDEDVPGLAFSPDERMLAVARTDGPVEFWDVQSGQLAHRYEWNIGRLGAIAFAPDGLTCAVAGDRGRIVIWDVDD